MRSFTAKTQNTSLSAPVRGTQSMVGVMSFVWKHPSLTFTEILWRWSATLPLLWLGWHALAPRLSGVHVDQSAVNSMTFLEPVRSASVFAREFRRFVPALSEVAAWWLPLALLVWAGAAALGRPAVLRRADSQLQRQTSRTGVVSLLRAAAFVSLLLCWAGGLRAAVYLLVIGPGHAGAEPNLVLLAAVAVMLTMLAFLAWSLSIWWLDLQPLLAMTGIESGWRQFPVLRSKLMETNLVMGIVRVILLVLAMTFSASPLPFQSRETQSFIDLWWVAVAMFYVLSSDFFHVVRRVTYLRLLQNTAQSSNAKSVTAS